MKHLLEVCLIALALATTTLFAMADQKAAPSK